MSTRKKRAADPGKLAGATGQAAEQEALPLDCTTDDDRHIANYLSAQQLLADNPDFKSRLESFALDRAEHGSQWGMQEFAEMERRKPHADSQGRNIGLDNTLNPIIARIIVKELPQVRPFVELRKSVYDFVLEDGELA